MEHIKETFARCRREKRAALVTYVTAGYPTADETVDILLGMEAGGAGEPLLYNAAFQLLTFLQTLSSSVFHLQIQLQTGPQSKSPILRH